MSQTGEPQYEQLALAYEVDRTRGGLSLVSLGPIQPISATEFSAAEETTPSGKVDWNSARLRVKYPHPSGDPDVAQVRLHLSKHSRPSNDGLDGGSLNSQGDNAHSLAVWTVESTEPETDATGKTKLWPDSAPDSEVREDGAADEDEDEEVWVLDLPKRELDLLLFDLSGRGYFGDQIRPRGLAQLEVTIDDGHTAKIWTPEPRLDDLVARVYRDGQADGFISRTEPEVEGAGWSL